MRKLRNYSNYNAFNFQSNTLKLLFPKSLRHLITNIKRSVYEVFTLSEHFLSSLLTGL